MKSEKSINVNGCSVCATGNENYTTFRPTHRPKQVFYQYDYRHTDGELFSIVQPTLERCREERDKWVLRKYVGEIEAVADSITICTGTIRETLKTDKI